MTLRFDSEVGAVLAPLFEGRGGWPSPPVGDVGTRRATQRAIFGEMAPAPPDGVGVELMSVTTADGAVLPMRWYRPLAGEPGGAAVLYLHGGGMIYSLEHLGGMYDRIVRAYVAVTGIPMLLVDYRVAPEYPHPTPVQDCYAALEWLHDHAPDLGVDPARVAVMGDSAGGGLTAAVGLLARDRGGPAIAAQLLLYPMLDDRTAQPDPELVSFATWTYDDNATGWGALLGAAAGGADVSPYAAPARAENLAALPPTYVDVGELDIFRDEAIDLARRLSGAGTPTELHVHAGCPHGFDTAAPTSAVTARAMADRLRRLRAL